MSVDSPTPSVAPRLAHAAAAAEIPTAAWVALAFLSFVNIFNYLDRMIMTVVGVPVKSYFKLSDRQLSLLTGPAFVLVYISATLVFGWLADRRNRRNVVAGVVALWSATTFLGGLARNFVELAIARAGVGLGEGGSNPASLSMISDYFPPQRRSVAVAIFQASGMIGLILTFALGGWVAANYGWRATLFVAGVPGLLTAIALRLVVREPKRRGFQGSAVAVPLRESIGMLRANPAYVAIIVASGFAVFGNLGIMQWLSIFFIRSHHLTLTQIGGYFGPGLALGMIAGMLLGGWIGERIGRASVGRSLYLCVWANIALVPLDLALLWVPSVHLALVLVPVRAALSVFYAPTLTAAMQTVAGPQVRGMAAAIFNFMNGLLGQALFPFVVAMLSDGLHDRYGEESLRYALSLVVPVYLLAAALFARASAVVSVSKVET